MTETTPETPGPRRENGSCISSFSQSLTTLTEGRGLTDPATGAGGLCSLPDHQVEAVAALVLLVNPRTEQTMAKHDLRVVGGVIL